MTHFISFDLIHFPSMPTQQVLTLPAQPIPVELVPQGPLVKVKKSRTPQARPSPAPVLPPTTFKEYCLSLPPAEQQLILHIHQYATDLSLLNCLNTQGISLCFCTNGGTLKHVGSIGWVIATNKDVLWDCSGSAFGWYANSFRSKGLSHLSLFVVLGAFVTVYCPSVCQPAPDLDTPFPK